MRADLKIIESWIQPSTSLLDLGCGEGTLLQALHTHKNVQGFGIEVDHHHVIQCIKNKVNVLQVDMEQGLRSFSDQFFDVAILSHTIQAIHTTESTLREMMRVARESIVTIPNFGITSHRLQLLFGRMPVSEFLPYQWYNTPNVRYCTIKDFSLLCSALNLTILERVVINEQGKVINVLPNLRGAVAIYRLGKN